MHLNARVAYQVFLLLGRGVVPRFQPRSTLPAVGEAGPGTIPMTESVVEGKLTLSSYRNSHVLDGFTCRPSLYGRRQLVIGKTGGASAVILADEFL